MHHHICKCPGPTVNESIFVIGDKETQATFWIAPKTQTGV